MRLLLSKFFRNYAKDYPPYTCYAGLYMPQAINETCDCKTFCKFSGFLDLDGTVSREGFQIQISPRYFTRGKRIVFMFSLIFEYKDDINLANFLCPSHPIP